MAKKMIAGVAAVVIVIGAILAYCAIPVGISKEVETLTADSEDGPLKVGIISDSQLGQKPVFEDYLVETLQFLKEQDVDMILNVGDYTDTALSEHYASYPAAFEAVYGDDLPITQSIMGNHDYWLPKFVDCWQIPFPGTLQRRFMEATGESSPWTHKVVNGYHFIGASPTNGGMGQEAYEKRIDWIKEQIDLAVQDDPNKPIFVLTHNNPQGTVYMSEDDGCQNLDDLFSKYPQVVSVSGHSHASLMDEQSIYQKNYTAVNTQCLSYVCFTADDADVVQEDSAFIDQVPMAMIMTVSRDKVTFDRYNMKKKERIGESWILPCPVTKDSFSYTDEIRQAASVAPTWPEAFTYEVTTAQDEEAGTLPVLSFTAATHPQALRYYNVTFTDADGNLVVFKDSDNAAETKTTLRFMSDYPRAPEDRAVTATFTIPAQYAKSLPAGDYTVRIQATSAFSEPSEEKVLEITIP